MNLKLRSRGLRRSLKKFCYNISDDADIDSVSPNRAHISWSPSSKSETLKRFVIQYDVTRELDSGEVLINNGYFVHFFAPPKLKPLKKHVVFVLDVSGSMLGRKIEQLKEAMREILKDLNSGDYLNIIIFSDSVTMWTPGDVYYARYDISGRSAHSLLERERQRSPFQPFVANSKNIDEAKNYIESLVANGGTNINDALIEALNLTARVRRARDGNDRKSGKNDMSSDEMSSITVLPPRAESMILFLTDGEPTVGETGIDKILRNIQLANLGISVPLFSLAFGSGADFNFLRKLSLQNHAFARKIYEASDAALQLQGFYAEISSPLLSNVEFNYTTPESPYSISQVTKRKFSTFFDGWELAVAGKIEESKSHSKLAPVDDSSEVDMPKPSRKMAHLTLLPYPPTDRCYFYSSISGMGYDGIHHWHRPLMYIRHPPWWCYPPPPPPPRPTTTTPRPPTDEESFLERLWAYLTIQNLIEKDISGSSESGETSKEKALRLALQYGFVTAQTSLVVVKPESTEVANAESVDARPQWAGSGGGRMRKASAGMRRFSKGSSVLMKASRPMMGMSHSKPMLMPMMPMGPHGHGGAAESMVHTKGSMDDFEDDAGPPPPPHSVTVKDRKKNKVTTSSPQYSLSDLTWLNGDKISITNEDGDTTEYRVAKTGKEMSNTSGVGVECSVGNKRSKLNKTTGKCQYLSKCVQEEFLDDFDSYQKLYFCDIKSTSSKQKFAGACCQ